MDRKGKTNYDRFPCSKDEQGNHLCRMCKSKLTGRKTSFCGIRCLRDFYMNTDWSRVRRVVYARDGGMCMKCSVRVPENDFHVDHIIPICKGGNEWDLSNLELSCPTCNLKKGGKIE